MVRFLFVSLCIINFIALHSFFFFSARLPLHSPSWPEQHVSSMVLKCRNKHRNFASWGKQFMEGTKCLISWLVISAGRASTLWPCAQSNRASLLSSFFPDFSFSPPASARRCSSICHPCSPVTLPLSFSKSSA